MDSKLTDAERARLAECEARIQAMLDQYWAFESAIQKHEAMRERYWELDADDRKRFDELQSTLDANRGMIDTMRAIVAERRANGRE